MLKKIILNNVGFGTTSLKLALRRAVAAGRAVAKKNHNLTKKTTCTMTPPILHVLITQVNVDIPQ